MNIVQEGIPQAGNGGRNTYSIQSTNRATHFGDYPYLFEQNDEYAPFGLKQMFSKSSGVEMSRISCGHIGLEPETGSRSLWQVASDLPDETNGFWGLETYETIGVHYGFIEMIEDNNDVHRPYEGVTVTIKGKKRTARGVRVTNYNPYSSEYEEFPEEQEDHYTTHTFTYADSFGAAGSGRDDIIINGYAPMSIEYAEEKQRLVVSTRTITREFESYPAQYYDSQTGQMVDYTRWRTKKVTEEFTVTTLDYNGTNWQYTEHSTPTNIQPSNFRESFS